MVIEEMDEQKVNSNGCDCIWDDDCLQQIEWLIRIIIAERFIINRSKCIWNSAGGSICGKVASSIGIGKSRHTWRGASGKYVLVIDQRKGNNISIINETTTTTTEC